MQTFTLVTVLKGHRGSVLGLKLSEDEQYLFSSSGKVKKLETRSREEGANARHIFLFYFWWGNIR